MIEPHDRRNREGARVVIGRRGREVQVERRVGIRVGRKIGRWDPQNERRIPKCEKEEKDGIDVCNNTNNGSA